MYSKKHWIFSLTTLSLILFNPAAHADEIYAQLANSGNQLTDKANINKPTAIIAQNLSSIAGMDWNKDKNALTIKEDGIYTIISEVQCGTRETISLPPEGGDMYYWLEADGKEITDTGNWVHVSPESKSNTIGNYFVLPLKAGTKLRFMFSTTIADIGVVSFRATELRPASPGLTVSIFKVGELP